MTPEQLKQEIIRLRADISSIEAVLTKAEGAFRKMFEDHLERMMVQLKTLEDRESKG